MKKIIIIPDVHGRKFWKPIVEKYKDLEEHKIIFLGDYLDPYLWEFKDEDDIYVPSRKIIDEIIDNFTEIVDIARDSSNITLLLGNHDLHYFPEFKNNWGCRRIDQKFDYISGIFLRNLDLFDAAMEVKTDNQNYIFSHAGILKGWLDIITGKRDFGGGSEPYTYFDMMGYTPEERALLDIPYTAEGLNSLVNHEIGREALFMVSRERGGSWNYGSCLWADIHEHFYDKLERLPGYQIFSHTLSYPDYDMPYIDKNLAMLDCKKGFELNLETGELSQINL